MAQSPSDEQSTKNKAQSSAGWWQTFFHGIALDLWRAAITPEHTKAEADFLQEHLDVNEGAKLLDVPCGNARLSIALAQRGYNLTGVDIASEFIDEARETALKLDLKIDLHNLDMRELPQLGTFDGGFCFGNSFGYLDDDGNQSFLLGVARNLKPGSRFLIETHAVSECTLPGFEQQRSFQVGDITLEIDSRYDYKQSRVFTEYNFIRDGKEDRRPSSQRIYTYHELAGLLETAGFSIESAYGSLKKEPFRLGAPSLLLIATRV
jgi:SAM-dependent methyltransferase